MANNKIINPLKAKWQTPFHRARAVYEEYPRQFWILMLGTFIDRTGGAALFPFFTLYVTHKFGVGMTEVGALWYFRGFKFHWQHNWRSTDRPLGA